MSADVAPISAFAPQFTARRSEVSGQIPMGDDMSERSPSFDLDRRAFLKAGVAAGGVGSGGRMRTVLMALSPVCSTSSM